MKKKKFKPKTPKYPDGGIPKWKSSKMELTNAQILSHVRNAMAAGDPNRGILKPTKDIVEIEQEYQNMTDADRKRVMKLLQSPEGMNIIQDDAYMRNHNFHPFNPFNVPAINRQQRENDRTYAYGGLVKYKNGGALPKFDPGGTFDETKVTGTNAYGKEQDNPYLKSQEVGTSNNMNWGMLANTVGQGAVQYANNSNLTGEQRVEANKASLNQTSDAVISQMPGWGQYYGLMNGASEMGKSTLKKDQYGNYASGTDKAANEIMTAQHKHLINSATDQNYTALALDSTGLGKFARMTSQMTGHSNDTEGGWGKFNKFIGIKPDETEGQYPYGGVYNLMHPFAKPGPMYMNKFPMGGNVVNPNAQLELEENTLNPDGSTTQFNLPPHEQQHPNAGTQLQPDTMIFSDKLRPKGEKKSYAQLNKINNTDKETKILDGKLSNALSLKTANLMKQVKNNNSMKLFNEQESLKASKINSYIKRLGGTFKYTDGGFVNNEPDPILTAKIKANTDPSKINPNINYGAYNAFQAYLNSKGLVNDPRMNTNEGRKALTDESINDFNTKSPYTKQFPKNTITANDILEIQKYHKQTDPNVVVDGWVGSQTSQMRYPIPYVDFGETDPKTGMPLDTTHAYPVKWGNKQYTLPGNKWKGYTRKDFTQVEQSGRPAQRRLGGLVKYEDGGYGPKTKLENDQYNTNSPMQFIGNPNDEPQLLHPSNFGYSNFQDWGQVGRAEQQMDSDIAASKKGNNTYTRDEIMKKDPYRYSNDTTGSNNSKGNWGNMAYQAGSWLANNLGELAYLKDNGKKYDKQDFYEYTPELMDPSASLRDADNMARIARYDLADKSVGNSGNYMANRSGLAVNTMLAKDKIRQEYGNINAGIKNQGKQYNIQNKYMTDDITARNKGAAYNQYYKSLERMGSNTAQSMKDGKSSKMEKDMLPFMKQAFSDPAFIEMFSKYMASQGRK